MGWGYSLLPVADEPVSNLTLRLTPAEKRERDEWMVGAIKHGLTFEQIAFEVGLSLSRVKQILKPLLLGQKVKKSKVSMRAKTPRDFAILDFEQNVAHPKCRMNSFYGSCNDCFGKFMLLESEYDDDGWPHDWATYGQEEFIAAANAAGCFKPRH